MPIIPGKQEVLIIANGAKPSHKRLQALAKDKLILVLDGAYDYAAQSGLKLNYLLGDFDSIKASELATAKSQDIDIIHAPNQNLTDLDKAIEFLDQQKFQSIHICAATDLRIDHTLHNIRLLSRYHHPKRPLTLYTETEAVFLLKDEHRVYQGKKDNGFAILGAPQCIVTTHGLRYDLNKITLAFAEASSVSNTMDDDVVDLTVEGSALVIHRGSVLSFQ